MKKIDITKPVQTRCGRKVTDLHWLSEPVFGGQVIHGVIETHAGERLGCLWHASGEVIPGEQRPNDLINVPEETVRWANVYPDWASATFSRTTADDMADSKRIGYFKFTFIEGQDPKAEFVPLEEGE